MSHAHDQVRRQDLLARALTSRLARALDWARHHPGWALGWAIATISVTLAVVGPYITPYDPVRPVLGAAFQPPSLAHPFGTDTIGLDVFSRVIAAPRIDITIALVGTALSLALGMAVGLVAGYYGGWLDVGIMRFADVIQAFPVFVLAMVLVASLGQGISSVIYAITFVNAPIYLRLTRGAVRSIREEPYVEAAVVAGFNDGTILARHVLPNVWSPAAIQSSVNVGWAVLLTAGLSFVGAGVRPPTPEWGSMVSSGSESLIVGGWWIALFPGMAIGLAVLGFALVADHLRARLEQ